MPGNDADQSNQVGRMALLGQLAAHLAHELNNVLMAVVGHAEVGRERIADSEATATLDKILKSAQQASKLTRNFLQFVSPPDDEASGDVAEAAENVLDLFSYRVSRENIDLEWNPGKPLPNVCMPTPSLELILANLLKNALDATRRAEKPRIRITAMPNGNYVTIRVWNAGPHISDEVQRRVTEPFFSTKQPCEGTGLGLALVNRLVAQSAGKLDISNVDTGGVQVRLHIPCASAPEKTQTQTQVPDEAQPERFRVLVVDDEQTVQEVFKLMMSDLSKARVETCGSGTEALEMLQKEQFDAVLLDLRMPDLCGEEVYDRLPDQLKQRVVFVTGDTMNTERTRFLSRTTQPALLKPVGHTELIDAVKKVMSKH